MIEVGKGKDHEINIITKVDRINNEFIHDQPRVKLSTPRWVERTSVP